VCLPNPYVRPRGTEAGLLGLSCRSVRPFLAHQRGPCRRRHPRRSLSGLVQHVDHGCQYTSIASGRRCRAAGILLSTSTVGDCFDNAMAASFFTSLECELIDRTRFRTREAARREVFSYIEGFHTTWRLRSSLGYLSPVEFERWEAVTAA